MDAELNHNTSSAVAESARCIVKAQQHAAAGEQSIYGGELQQVNQRRRWVMFVVVVPADHWLNSTFVIKAAHCLTAAQCTFSSLQVATVCADPVTKFVEVCNLAQPAAAWSSTATNPWANRVK
jgi:hypothetical protein